MASVIDLEDGDGFETVIDHVQAHGLAADLQQVGLVLALLVASLLWLLWINDVRTSLSLLHSAVTIWPRTIGPLHTLSRDCLWCSSAAIH